MSQKSLDFVKMHGLGNDFVVFRGPLEISSSTVAKICDRHTGVGADGVLVITGQSENTVRMEYWNADGSTAEMCGNGLRCATKFAVDNNIVKPGNFSVITGVGPLEVVWDGTDETKVEVQVGRVVTDEVPVVLEGLTFYRADVGNPHAITFVQDTREATVSIIGPKVEHDKTFPNRTNVEFAQIVDEEHIRLRIWERGVGETLACGTGMVSTAVVSAHQGFTQMPVSIEVPGGMAKVWVDDSGLVRMRGPALTVFSGRITA